MAVLDARETLFLELLNRARLDPTGEAARLGISLPDLNSGLTAGTISTAPKQILAWNPLLSDSSTSHSNWMLGSGNFSHTGSGNSTATQRMQAAGYALTGSWNTGENLAWSGSPSAFDYNAAVLQQHKDLLLSAGHRANMLKDVYREVGVAAETGVFTGYNALMTTFNFARSGSNYFVAGVSYNDTDNNDFYSIGEGIGNRTVKLMSGVSVLATTASQAAGAYSLATTATGTLEIVYSGGGLPADMGALFTMASGNVKFDIVDNNTIETSTSATLTRSAQNMQLLGIDNVNATGNNLANTLNGNEGNNTLDGGAGNDTLNGGEGADQLIGGNGDDALNGGGGTDTANFSGAIVSYVITYNPLKTTYTLYGADGFVDVVAGVEQFQFSDGSRSANQLTISAAAPIRRAAISAVVASQPEGNSGQTNYSFEVRLDAAAYGPQTINWSVAGTGISAANAVDFTGATSGVVSFAKGESLKVITVGVTGDALEEANEAFRVTLSDTSSGIQLTTATADATILNDDAPVLNQITGTDSGESLSGTAAADRIDALGGNDWLIGGGGNDVLNGGDGVDYADYYNSFGAVIVNLATGAGRGGDATGDSLISIERVIGSLSFDDTLTGNDGDNYLNGYGGNNILSGGLGNDELQSGAGSDILSGGEGNDWLIGGAGGDNLDGGNGEDLVNYYHSIAGVRVNLATGVGLGGDAQGDSLIAVENLFGSNLGNDTLTGNDASNYLNGYGGDDTLSGGIGGDSLIAGEGNDLLIGGAGADLLDGGNGVDYADYSTSSSAVNVNLATGTGSSGDAQSDVLVSIERVFGSATFGDTLTGNADDNYLSGQGGADALNGGMGNDELDGGAGNDVLRGNDGNDLLIGGLGGDTLDGGEGVDYVNYYHSSSAVTINLSTGIGSGGDAQGDYLIGIENLLGSNAGGDTLTGNAGDNYFNGYGGNDTLSGGLGSDTLFGGDGTDTLIGGVANDILNGGLDADSFVFDTAGFGVDTVMNFEDGVDKISVASALAPDFASLSISNNNSTFVTLSFGGGQVYVTAASLVNLDQSDFIFA